MEGNGIDDIGYLFTSQDLQNLELLEPEQKLTPAEKFFQHLQKNKESISARAHIEKESEAIQDAIGFMMGEQQKYLKKAMRMSPFGENENVDFVAGVAFGFASVMDFFELHQRDAKAARELIRQESEAEDLD